jgi:TPR repeat protein
MNEPDTANNIAALRARADNGDLDAALHLGQVLLQHGNFGSSEFDEAIARLEQAASQDHPGAQLLLAHVLVQVHALPDADARAAHWYAAAADKGHPEALARLADLYLTGRGVGRDDTRAFACITNAADQCYPQLQCDLAYMIDHGMGCEANAVAATDWYLRALAQGSHQAAFALALRYASGVGVGRDNELALALFDCARGGNFPAADAWYRRLADESDATGVQAATKVAAGIRQAVTQLPARFAAAGLQENAADESSMRRMAELVAEHWDSLGDDRLSIDATRRATASTSPRWPVVANPGLQQAVLWRPRVFRLPQFLSEYERAHLIALTAPRMAAAEEFSRDATEFEKDFFTGSAARLGATLGDPVIRNVERRIARAAMLPTDHIEPLSVLRYGGDDAYEAHVDYLTPDRLADAHGGQRVVTFICYLRAPESGGETEYVNAGHAVSGEAGLALLHYNCLPDGRPDDDSLHASRPVLAGEKWLLRTAIHAGSLYRARRRQEASS